MVKDRPQSPKVAPPSAAATGLSSARLYLEREIDLGLELIPRAIPRVTTDEAEERDAGAASSPQRSPAESARPGSGALAGLFAEPGVAAASTLEALARVLGDCQRCKLCSGRSNIVFGVGNPQARLMFVGEGPGAEEDQRGEPFVGRAGRLLDSIITKGMGLSRKQVYIANVVKCRPPGNRNPQPDEIVACEPFLARQIDIIAPEVIITLGTFATQALLRNRLPISKLRGHWYEYGGVAVMPTFHPAYLLRSPGEKRVVWEDIKNVMARLGMERG